MGSVTASFLNDRTAGSEFEANRPDLRNLVFAKRLEQQKKTSPGALFTPGILNF